MNNNATRSELPRSRFAAALLIGACIAFGTRAAPPEAPRSSHFYTPYDTECSMLKGQGGNPWIFEGSAFALKLPTASATGLACPLHARPLYRAYNNGMSGAPNHRYSTEETTLDEMIAQGWIMEGDGASRIFACVPLQPVNAQ